MNWMRKSKARKCFKKPKGKLLPVDLSEHNTPNWMTRAFMNNRYVVMIDDNALMECGMVAIKAMIQRHDDKPIPRHWKEIQSIKNELFGNDSVGIEYYPAEDNLIDDHNIYWLWIFPKGVIPTWDKTS